MLRWIPLLLVACGSDPYGGLYDACDDAPQCAERLDTGVEAQCVDKSGLGFCTWSCAVDADCAETHDAIYDYLCASFEDEPEMYCFPDCLEDTEGGEPSCPPGYNCRSTGGGSNNRQVCFPQ